MRRIVTVVTVMLVALLGTPSAGAQTAQSFEVIRLAIDVVVGPDDDTPCRIVANLYRPENATPETPAPAILTTHGFGGSRESGDQVAIGFNFAKQGYVVLSYSGLGFGGSGCKIYLDDPDWDGKAGSQLVDVLAGTKSAVNTETGESVTVDYVQLDRPGDPRIGMIGGSYGGQIQYAVAAVSGKIDALVPIVTWNDLVYSLAPNNTSLTGGVRYSTPGVHKKQWTSLFFGSGIISGAENVTVDPNRMVGCPNFHDPVCTAKAQVEATGYPGPEMTELGRHASVTSYLDKITMPTLLLQGQKDSLFNLQEAIATYQGLKAQGTPVAMMWQSWGHSLGSTALPGELDLSAEDIRATYQGRRIADWFDHWLRGRDTPVGPEIDYFRDWVYEETEDVAEAYKSADAYPVGRTRSLYLSGADQLTGERATVAAGEQSFTTGAGGAPTSYSETSGLEGVYVNQPVSDTAGTYAAWTSPPLTRDLAIAGVPSLDVRISAPTAELSQEGGPAGMLVLFAKVYDVAPDGSVELKNRLVSPVRIPDVGEPVRIELPGVVHQFAAGHRIRVVLAAGDAAYAGNTLAHPVTVRTSPLEPGVLRLPVVGPPPSTTSRR
ncbi:MAG: CocE/NonD family hydrolase [Micromonosporaceae bacterium]